MADCVIEMGRIGSRTITIQESNLTRQRELFNHALGQLQQLGQDPVPGTSTPGIFQTLLGFLGSGLGVLGDVVGFPLNLIGTGGDFIIRTLADLAKNVPIVGELISDILLAGNTLLQAGLSLPGATLAMLGNLLKSFSGLPKDEQDSLQKKSMEKIQAKANEAGQGEDLKKIQGMQVAGAMPPALKVAAGVAAPLTGGAIAFLALRAVLGDGGAAAAGGAITAGGLGLAYMLGAFD